MSEIKWRGDALIVSPDYCLVLSEKDYHLALDEIEIPKDGRNLWISNDRSNATVHTFGENHVVCLRYKSEDLIAIYSILVHEAVHIWQNFCEKIGETSPSTEFEAYAIQQISINLMGMYNEIKADENVKF